MGAKYKCQYNSQYKGQGNAYKRTMIKRHWGSGFRILYLKLSEFIPHFKTKTAQIIAESRHVFASKSLHLWQFKDSS